MLTDLAKLRRRRKRSTRIAAVKSVNIQKSVENTGSEIVYNREFLKNRNLSIMTDDEPDFSLGNNSHLRKPVPKGFNNFSNTNNNFESYGVVTTKEQSAVPVSVWDNVEHGDIANSVKENSVSQTFCSPGCSSAWYLKFRRQVLKCLRNKVYPGVVNGLQESDGGFFENLGTLLAEKARVQQQAEGPLPKPKEEIREEEVEESASEDGSIEEPVDALLETDSDRDEDELATSFLCESVGWNALYSKKKQVI